MSFGRDGSLGFEKRKSKAMAEAEIIEREEEDEGAAAGKRVSLKLSFEEKQMPIYAGQKVHKRWNYTK